MTNIEKIKFICNLYWELQTDLNENRLDTINYDFDLVTITRSILNDIESRFDEHPSQVSELARLYAQNIDKEITNSNIVKIIEECGDRLTFEQFHFVHSVMYSSYSLLNDLCFFNPDLELNNISSGAEIKKVEQDRRFKNPKVTNYQLAYSINYIFGKQIGVLSKKERATLLQSITGRSGEDLRNHLAGTKLLTKEQRDEIENQLRDIKNKLSTSE